MFLSFFCPLRLTDSLSPITYTYTFITLVTSYRKRFQSMNPLQKNRATWLEIRPLKYQVKLNVDFLWQNLRLQRCKNRTFPVKVCCLCRRAFSFATHAQCRLRTATSAKINVRSNMANLRQTPLTCSGHTRPVVDLAFSDITPYGYFLISACKGTIQRSIFNKRS